jgi:hypothetical protein
MPPAGFELAIPASDRPKILSLERSATEICCLYFLTLGKYIDSIIVAAKGGTGL